MKIKTKNVVLIMINNHYKLGIIESIKDQEVTLYDGEEKNKTNIKNVVSILQENYENTNKKTINELIAELSELNPNIDWDLFLKDLNFKRSKIVLIIKRFNEEL